MPSAKSSAFRPSTRGAGSSRPLWLWLGLALLVIVADQLTKTLVIAQFALGDSQTVTPWFNLVRVHNAGAAFSFLAGASGWQRWFFVGLGAVASVFIVWMLRKHPGERLFCAAISLILGGALGNVIDTCCTATWSTFCSSTGRCWRRCSRAATFPASTSPTAPSRSVRSA